MPEIPFVGGAYRGRSGPQNSQSCQNLFPVLSKDGKVVRALYGTPGLTPWTTDIGSQQNAGLRFTGDLARTSGFTRGAADGVSGQLSLKGDVSWLTPCSVETVVISYTSEQMYLSGTQNLTASGGIRPYTWSIQSGGGSFSTLTGDATTYTAPAINPNCMYNATIRCTDYCDNYAEIHVAITNETLNAADAYRTLYIQTSATCSLNRLYYLGKTCNGDDHYTGPQICLSCVLSGSCCMGHWCACPSAVLCPSPECLCDETRMVEACNHGQNSPGYDGNCKALYGHCAPGEYDHRTAEDLSNGCCPRAMFYGGDTE